MIKRIPCRVVRTKPLDKSGSAMTSNHLHHKIGDNATGIPQGKYTSTPTTYTRLLEITSVSMDNGLGGQILDCYV